MGFIKNLLSGVKNVSGTVGKVAGLLSGIPIVGGVASSVANVANMINKGASFGEKIYDAVAPAAQEIGGEVKKVIDSGKQAWNAGKQAIEAGKSAINQVSGGMGESRQGFRSGGPPRGGPPMGPSGGGPPSQLREARGAQAPTRTVVRM